MLLFVDIPEDQRLEAMQSAILLLPDVNRLSLYALLRFLADVASHSKENQVGTRLIIDTDGLNLMIACFLKIFYTVLPQVLRQL